MSCIDNNYMKSATEGGICYILGYLYSPRHYKWNDVTQKHTHAALIYLPFHKLWCVAWILFYFFFFFCHIFTGSAKTKKKRAKFVWATTPWLRIKAAFVLSLIESLLLFIGARQPGQQGRQSYADCIEGLHYLGASYFLFSLKGRVRESISLAGRVMASKRREGKEECVCARERESYKGSGSLWDAQGSGGGEKKSITPEQYLCICTAAFCQQYEGMWFWACALRRTYARHFCVHKLHMHLHV